MTIGNWLSLIGLIISILSFLGFGGWMIKIQQDKKGKRKAEIKEVVLEVFDPMKKDLELLKNGEQASLRNDLLAKYRECSEIGFRTIRDTQDWEDMYIAYHDLGGNSFIDQTRIDFMRIPTEERYKVIHSKDNEK